MSIFADVRVATEHEDDHVARDRGNFRPLPPEGTDSLVIDQEFQEYRESEQSHSVTIDHVRSRWITVRTVAATQSGMDMECFRLCSANASSPTQRKIYQTLSTPTLKSRPYLIYYLTMIRAEKNVVWMGNSLDVLQAFPKAVRADLGADLRRLQIGELPLDSKPMWTVGPGVRELRARDRNNQFRTIYAMSK